MPGIIASKHRKTPWQVESRNNTATLALSRREATRGMASLTVAQGTDWLGRAGYSFLPFELEKFSTPVVQ